MKSVVVIDAGICGHKTTVTAVSEDKKHCTLAIETDCKNIARMAEDLDEVNPLFEIGVKSKNSKIRKGFLDYGSHAACPVPAGLVKAVEVASGLAVPKDAIITVSKG
ncbi:hypothetical protein MFMK1_003238 [Metallumcola ferriviriculae]|uniref:Uncharacterized protein n=1 Tax=Metallumcola ferriviriculae TaxID=3039180 RepID=A0AAU0URF8_9FIRM|nr:hypothetical protein MFMK1_003238 [Desulfitibacteraceae bacterium MK1]